MLRRLFFVALTLLFGHGAIDRFFGKRGKFRRYLAFASAKDKRSDDLLQPFLHTDVSLPDRNDKLLMKSVFFS